jgi:hypothetical protein
VFFEQLPTILDGVGDVSGGIQKAQEHRPIGLLPDFSALMGTHGECTGRSESVFPRAELFRFFCQPRWRQNWPGIRKDGRINVAVALAAGEPLQ